MPIDPFTGASISPGTAVVRCPRGHISLPDSWVAAGNRCSYPGCGYSGNPRPAGVLPAAPLAVTNASSQTSATASSASVNVLSQTSTAVPPESTLNIRVHGRQQIQPISVRRLWWPTFWSSVASAVVTMVSFAVVAVIGWHVLLANAGVPSELVSTYIPINATFAVLAGITIFVAGFVLTLLRLYWHR